MSKISQLINKLQEIKDKEGDVNVVCYGNGMQLIDYDIKRVKVTNQVFIIKDGIKKRALAEPWDYVKENKKENLKAGKVLTKKRLVRL